MLALRHVALDQRRWSACENYTCLGPGWPSCAPIGNGVNIRRTFCDYNAGCPIDCGFIEGQPTTLVEICTQNGPLKRSPAGCARWRRLTHAREACCARL
jgi:hypothetical protein